MKSRYYDPRGNQLKLSFLAPSGYGKTTAAEFLRKEYHAVNLKLAAPLYEFQKEFYRILQIDISGRQDGELLQFLGNKIQRDYPYFLADNFFSQLSKVTAVTPIITNDDCRPHNYPYLKEMGFFFIRISGKAHVRDDISTIDSSNAIEWRNDIPYDFVVDNNGDIPEYEEQLRRMVRILGEEQSRKEMLCNTNGTVM